MVFPSMTKQNMRYRGPMESEKINRFSNAQVYDALQVSKQLALLADKIATLRKGIYSGDESYSTIGLPDMSIRFDGQTQQLKQIKEAIT